MAAAREDKQEGEETVKISHRYFWALSYRMKPAEEEAL